MKTTSKIGVLFVIAAVALLLVPASAEAQQRSGIGLGFVLGEPSGIAAVSWLGGGNAVDLVGAWSFGGGGSFYLHADYQYHSWVEQPLSAFFGLGGFVQLQDDPVLGVRVPLGITYLFQDLPMDVFVEVAPGMALVPGTDFVIGGGLGLRYYF
ncbi:MAG: hypothetical protein ACOC2N_03205 [Spirochaetota bacterium]